MLGVCAVYARAKMNTANRRMFYRKLGDWAPFFECNPKKAKKIYRRIARKRMNKSAKKEIEEGLNVNE
jgi:hypothetical protein